MNTKRRLSDDLSNDSEILSEKRFVKLYKEELESIEKQIHDLKKLDQKDFDLSNVAEEARQYVAAILTGVVIRHFVEAIAFERGHSLDVRRYMWQMEY